jgi:hypothetical protein
MMCVSLAACAFTLAFIPPSDIKERPHLNHLTPEEYREFVKGTVAAAEKDPQRTAERARDIIIVMSGLEDRPEAWKIFETNVQYTINTMLLIVASANKKKRGRAFFREYQRQYQKTRSMLDHDADKFLLDSTTALAIRLNKELPATRTWLDTVKSLVVMFLAFPTGLAITMIVVMLASLAGGVGAWIHHIGEGYDSPSMRAVGFSLATIGQSAILSTYSVAIVIIINTVPPISWPTWPLWIVGFFHSGAASLVIKSPQQGTEAWWAAQYEAMKLSCWVGTIVFFVAAIWPSVLEPVFSWMPRFAELIST